MLSCFDVGAHVRPPPSRSLPPAPLAPHAARAPLVLSSLSRNVINTLCASTQHRIQFRIVDCVVHVFNMKKEDSLNSLSKSERGSRPVRLLMDSVSSDEGPETERLLGVQLPAAVVAAASPRRESLTVPPSPTDSRKKHHHRHHHYRNQLQHLIHWRDIWGGEPHKVHEVVIFFPYFYMNDTYSMPVTIPKHVIVTKLSLSLNVISR